MTASQIILYAIAAVILLLAIRRRILRLGMREYAPVEVMKKLNDPSVVLLDVRSHQERNRGRIDGSLHIPLNDLAMEIESLGKYRQKEFICYCQTGSRSLTAARILQKHGFSATNMKGGMAEWNYLNLGS